MTVDEAVALIARRVCAVAGIETVPLAQADSRICAEECRAPGDLPPFDNAAVDGYAVRHAALAPGGETVLPLGGRLTAGASAEGVLAGDTAVRIFTGAPMPHDADTVFMQEDVRAGDDRVVLPHGLKLGANRRRAGEDVGCGDRVIPAGRRLRPQDLALAAAVGFDRLAVRRPLRVALFSTGDELTEPGATLRPGAIHDANRVMLGALLRRLGVAVSDLGILRDEPEVLARRLAAASADHDLILTSGGVSVGEEDHVKAAVEAVGRLAFWRLAIRPGRPVAMGQIGRTPFVGLPGNPVAAYVTLLFVVRPLIARLAGQSLVPLMPQPVRAAFSYRKKPGRREYLRVSLASGADGVVAAQKYPKDGSAALTSLTESDGLAELLDDAAGVSEGETIRFYPHALLW
ncbi:Molybdopterin molybdenumtransferase [Methylobacterium haplocladii]|uniref:Molybdopterin molybdenumtransferase n=3 Tax=Methylobacterium haplocladii TaxID=1176176 RepID=A0A512ITP4_9HYPH|nr:molybdopterin molybdenumtransferase MoeA [Methylobacterium haplocladii]GJD85622.1 Molybdopterin molybdenumtransferase [Methylobacterium haplocladii]